MKTFPARIPPDAANDVCYSCSKGREGNLFPFPLIPIVVHIYLLALLSVGVDFIPKRAVSGSTTVT